MYTLMSEVKRLCRKPSDMTEGLERHLEASWPAGRRRAQYTFWLLGLVGLPRFEI